VDQTRKGLLKSDLKLPSFSFGASMPKIQPTGNFSDENRADLNAYYKDWSDAANRRLQAIHTDPNSYHPAEFIAEKAKAVPLWIAEHGAQPDFTGGNTLTQQRSDALEKALNQAQDTNAAVPSIPPKGF
jgi:hypothetical protein